MKQSESFEAIKRIIYLWIIPFILLILIAYYIFYPDLKTGNPINIFIVRMFIIWYTISWFFIYKKRFFHTMEIGTIAVITFSHIVTVYDSIANYMVHGLDQAIGIDVIWTPLLVLIYFLVLGARGGLIYSLGIFSTLVAIGVYHLNAISSDYILPLSQYYFAFFVYILTYYLVLRILKFHVEIESIQKIAYTDSLTGIANRLQIDNWLENQLKNSTKNDTPLSILFFDMDYFKKVNDTFGHKVGDSVLIELSNIVKSQLSKEDLLGRWGGEEFIIVTRISKDKAKKLAEQVRDKISQHDFAIVGKQTASFGVTEAIIGESVDTLLNRVDSGLYHSKQSGRDLVTLI